MPPGIQRILIPAEDLTARVAELGRQVRDDYAGRTPMLVGVLKGAVVFLADLMRAINAPCECDFIAVSSYGASTRSSGIVELTKDLSVPIEGRDVLIVEDIVDTGRTLAYLRRNLETRQPGTIRVCTLLDKASMASWHRCTGGSCTGTDIETFAKSKTIHCLMRSVLTNPSSSSIHFMKTQRT